MNDVMDDLEKEREANKMFYTAYRMIELKRRKVEKKDKEPVNKVTTETVRSIWRLGEIEHVEI